MVIDGMEIPKRKYNKKGGYTVSVVYFLRKEKENPADAAARLVMHESTTNNQCLEDPRHPIYVRVTFLGKTVGLRSRLRRRVTVSEYDSYMSLEETIRFIKLEEATIRETIRLFKPETNPNFKISEWSYFYNRSNFGLYFSVHNIVMTELRNALRNHPVFSTYPNYIRELTGNLQALPFLASLNVGPAIFILEKYLPLLKMLSIEKSNYIDFSYTGPDYCVWDWRTGSLRQLFESENNPFLALGGPMLDDIMAKTFSLENTL